MGGAASGELAALQRRVEEWRRQHGGRAHPGAPIPEEIWQAAVEVARVLGVGATARALRFNAGRLQRRVAESEHGRRGAPAFVELGAPVLGVGGATVIELVGADGERMRVELGAGTTLEVASLAQSFWSRRR